jgi:Flp pilus assembly protein TadD
MRRPGEPLGSAAPDRAGGLVDAAAEAFEAGRLEDALARADEALAAAPRSVAALHYRAAALAELGRLEPARAAFEGAL